MDELALTFPSEAFQHADYAVVADSFEDEAHAVSTLAELVLGLGRGYAFNASLDALGTPAAHDSREPSIFLGLSQLAAEFLSQS